MDEVVQLVGHHEYFQARSRADDGTGEPGALATTLRHSPSLTTTPRTIRASKRQFLMPPDVREWLPEGHLAWFVLDAVGEMDLAAFYAAYRSDGHGRAA